MDSVPRLRWNTWISRTLSRGSDASNILCGEGNAKLVGLA